MDSMMRHAGTPPGTKLLCARSVYNSWQQAHCATVQSNSSREDFPAGTVAVLTYLFSELLLIHHDGIDCFASMYAPTPADQTRLTATGDGKTSTDGLTTTQTASSADDPADVRLARQMWWCEVGLSLQSRMLSCWVALISCTRATCPVGQWSMAAT